MSKQVDCLVYDRGQNDVMLLVSFSINAFQFHPNN